MKKIFLALLFSAVLFIGLPYYNIKAMSVTYDIPFSYVPDVADLYLGMLAGGQYDFSDISTLEEAAIKHKESLQQGYHFLQNFATKLWNWQVTQAGLGNTTLNEDSDMVIYVSPYDIAAFMGYNLRWWDRESTIDSDVSIPAAYYEILKYVGTPSLWNSSFLWWTYDLYLSRYSSDYKIRMVNNTLSVSNLSDYSGFGDVVNGDITFTLSPIRLDVNTSTLSYTYSTFTFDRIFRGVSKYTDGYNHFIAFNNFNGNQYGIISNWGYSNQIYPVKSGFADLTALFTYIGNHWRNCDLYVDGIQWVSTNSIDDYITAPDVIQVGDTGIESYDVFIPDIPGYEGLSINGFLEWLNTRLGEKDIGLDDLIEDAPDIIVTVDENNEPTTRPITYDDVKPAPLVIDGDTTADPNPDNPTPTPSPDPTTFPLPPFPKFPIPSDIPNANIQHTVLAEIVEATDTVVPQDLMILIWSTFSLMIIGGIIYILHK